MELLYAEDTEKVIGQLMAVHNAVGPGLDELAYQDACERLFHQAGTKFHPQASRRVMHRDRRVKELIPDFVVEDKFVLDLKVLVGDFPPGVIAQLFCYCKLFEVPLGLLANFGMQSLGWKRFMFAPKQGELIFQNTDALKELSPSSVEVFRETARAIRFVWESHGPGYTDDIYAALIQAELSYRRLPFKVEPLGQATLNGRPLRPVRLPVIVVSGICPVCVHALFDEPTATHRACMQTYLSCLGLPSGLLVNFGKENSQIVAVCARK